MKLVKRKENRLMQQFRSFELKQNSFSESNNNDIFQDNLQVIKEMGKKSKGKRSLKEKVEINNRRRRDNIHNEEDINREYR